MGRHRRSAARRYDAVDQEPGGRHVAVLRGSRQDGLKHRFDALRRERVEARPSGLGQRDGLSLRASSSPGFRCGFSHVRADLDTRIKYDLATTSGRAPEEIVEVALAGYLEEMALARETLDSRYDDLKSGRVKPIDGEEAFRKLREKSERRRSGG